jgi:PAS domain S-box-containing protein
VSLEPERAGLFEENCEELYENAPCGYLSSTVDGMIVKVNTTFASWLGYEKEQLAGQLRLLDLLTIGGKIFYETHFALLIRMYGEVNEIAMDFKRKDGGILSCLVSARQKRDSAGTPLVNRVTIFNTTERRRYEQELMVAKRRAEEISADLVRTNSELARSNGALLKANEELGEFAYAASHDLQEPLRTITAYAQLLERRHRQDLKGDALLFLGNIVEGSQRMQALIGDLLSLSQAQGSHLILRPTNLSEPLRIAISNLRSAIEESGAIISSGELPVVSIDIARTTQLFQNLLGNAMKYRKPEEQPRIEVSSSRGPREWTFSVRDNGTGFEPKFAEQIFGMFKRLHGREILGTGIGLALCKKIVESHGGHIWAESTPGEGSVFRFTIPIAPSEPADLAARDH